MGMPSSPRVRHYTKARGWWWVGRGRGGTGMTVAATDEWVWGWRCVGVSQWSKAKDSDRFILLSLHAVSTTQELCLRFFPSENYSQIRQD